MATSLQVFHNLGSLRTIVDSEISSCKGNLHSQIKSCLDVQSISHQQTGPQGKGSACISVEQIRRVFGDNYGIILLISP